MLYFTIERTFLKFLRHPWDLSGQGVDLAEKNVYRLNFFCLSVHPFYNGHKLNSPFFCLVHSTHFSSLSNQLA